MATKVQTEKPTGDVLKKIYVNPSTKIKDTNSNMKVGIPIDADSHISPSGDTASTVKESEIDQESLIVDQNPYYPPGNYYGYYYPGFNYYSGDWDEQGWVVENDGAEMQYPAIQSDNDGSIVYYMPNYSPYIPYVPGVVFGSDGQYLSHQSYVPNSLFPQPIASPVYFPPPVAYGSEVTPAYQLDSTVYGDGNTVGGHGGNPAVHGSKINFSSSTNNNISSIKSTASTKSNSLDNKVSTPSRDVNNNLNQPLKPNTKATQPGSGFSAAAVLAKGYLPVAKFPPSHGKGGLLYSSNPFSMRTNNRGWVNSEKSKSMGKINSTHDFDLFNEQNRGPRTSISKNNWVAGEDASTPPCSEDNGNNEKITIIRREQFNLSSFETKYDNALFFVIKSYSEDDVHKSIKYGVWASTPNGNKRLDNAFVDAQERLKEKGIKCPIFLFFSVNASGQFCGVAEMINRVDFTKNMTFWQQDKWNGFFPVKWHIVKDVPNPQFRHIILENNDNKAVTNSRDTQEVKFPQGIEMLNIFKNYTSKTSILDDFDFYERRQKAMQDKRTHTSVEYSENSPKPHVALQGEKIDSLATELQSLELTWTKIGNEDSQLVCDVKE